MAGKLIITRGLPASGKSTWAEEFRITGEALGVEVRVVTMDDIRVAIGSKFESGDESIVLSIRDIVIRKYLWKEYTVISADTNLNPRTLNDVIKNAEAVSVEYVVRDFTDVPLETCLERNVARWARGDCKVPDQAIVKMHQKYLSNH